MLGLLPKGIQIVGKTKKQIMEMIKKAPIKPRFKKFLQGETLGEAQIKPAIKGHRAVVPYELKAFTKGAGGALSLTAIYDALTSEMKTTPTEPKSGPMRFAGRGVKKPKPQPKKKVSNVGKNAPMGSGIKTISIKKGDTLSAIARKNNTTVSTLKKLNPNVKPKEMKIGGSLKIPRTGGTR